MGDGADYVRLVVKLFLGNLSGSWPALFWVFFFGFNVLDHVTDTMESWWLGWCGGCVRHDAAVIDVLPTGGRSNTTLDLTMKSALCSACATALF
jgi:hypothetical protein